jgi:hypothetical protein
MTALFRAGAVGGLLLLAAAAVAFLGLRGGQGAEASPERPAAILKVDAALEEAQACMVAAGLDATINPGEGRRLATITYSVPPAGEVGAPSAATMADANDCLATHYNKVAEDYILSLGAPSPGAIDMLYDRIEACLENPPDVEVRWLSTGGYAGTDRKIVITSDQKQDFAKCAHTIQAETGLAAPNPIVRD